MSVIRVDFKEIALRDARFVAESAEDVRVRCKELLDQVDYEDFLMAVMDADYYATVDEDIQKLVDAYYERMDK